MLSAIVIAADASVPVVASPEAIVRTLASLVPAAIEGVIRDLTLASHGDAEAMRQIADHAGCELAIADRAEGVIGAGLASARGDLVLVIRAGFAPHAGFIEEMSDLFGRGPGARPALLRADGEGFLTRLAPSLAPVAGLIAPRKHLAPQARDLNWLAKGVGGARTMRVRLRRVE